MLVAAAVASPFGVRECLWPETRLVCVEAHIFCVVLRDSHRRIPIIFPSKRYVSHCFSFLIRLLRSFVRSLNKNKRCVLFGFAGSTDGCLKGQRNIDIASLKASKDHGNAAAAATAAAIAR